MVGTQRELHFEDIPTLASGLRTREYSSEEVTRIQLQRITALDPHLRAYVEVFADEAIADARLADSEMAHGRFRGPLHGIPIGVKDLCHIKGHPTAGGMSFRRERHALQDATVVARLRQAGAVILGSLQLTEGAYSDYHPSVSPPKNPWDPRYWTGNSSSGSAVATASGICFGAIGTDTGGSIRWPAAANGVTGLKPTWGRVSRFGVLELAASLDHVGTIARSAIGAGMMLQAISGYDPLDSTSLRAPALDIQADASVKGLRLGLDSRILESGLDDSVRNMLTEAVEVLVGRGAVLVNMEFPDASQAVRDWVPNCAVEAAVAHELDFADKEENYGPVLAGVIRTGQTVSGTDLQKILQRRRDYAGALAAALEHVDVAIVPVQPFEPLSLETIATLGEKPELIEALQRFTSPFNMSGSPTITLPAGFSENQMPMAFQLVAQHLCEDRLVRAGAAYQAETYWHTRHPRLS